MLAEIIHIPVFWTGGGSPKTLDFGGQKLVPIRKYFPIKYVGPNLYENKYEAYLLLKKRV